MARTEKSTSSCIIATPKTWSKHQNNHLKELKVVVAGKQDMGEEEQRAVSFDFFLTSFEENLNSICK